MSGGGTNVPRKDGIAKATGAARYADDLTFPDMLFGRTIRSTIPRGRIRNIRLDFDTAGFTMVDHRDIPGRNAVDLMEKDQPFLAEHQVRHMAEPILLLAHENRETLNAARVVIEYDEEPALFDPTLSTEIYKSIDIRKGDTVSALVGADVIVEGTYRTGHQEHIYIEPNGVIAVPDGDGITIHGSIHAAGPYRCDNIRIQGKVVYTNTPPNGAFRGFGAPQTHRFREQARTVSRNEPRHRSRAVLSRRGIRGRRRTHASLTGGGERMLRSRARLELTATGVGIATGSTEIDQGTRTMHAQIVTDALGIPYEHVEVAQPDTALVADSGPTVASRTCMVVGKILEECAYEMKGKLGALTPAEYYATNGELSVERVYEPPDWIEWDDKTYLGDAYATYGWGCDVAELEVDADTFEVRPIRLTAVQEFGRPIHPAMARGQIEGGTAQGLGYALLERVVMKNGATENAQLTNYTIPTTLDMPELDLVMMDNPYPGGPFGAKGLGELPMDGPAPAIVNALRHIGMDVREIPATHELLSTCVATV